MPQGAYTIKTTLFQWLLTDETGLFCYAVNHTEIYAPKNRRRDSGRATRPLQKMRPNIDFASVGYGIRPYDLRQFAEQK